MAYRDTIPVFVYHHHAQKHAQREEEEAIDVMLDGVANGRTEGEHDDLCDGEERCAEQDVSYWPTILKGPENEDKLGDDIDNSAD